MRKNIFWLLLVIIVVSLSLVGLVTFFSAEKTVTGNVIETVQDWTIAGKPVTIFKLISADGEYYLGMSGHKPELQNGQKIEVTFALHEYVAKGFDQATGKFIGYREVKKYKILPRN